MKNYFYHIVPLLFTDYSLPVLLLPVGMGNEGRPIYPAEKIKQGESRCIANYNDCSLMQSAFENIIYD
jgi:hypothetical protein